MVAPTLPNMAALHFHPPRSAAFAEVATWQTQQWPPGRCTWSGGRLRCTRGGKKLASTPLPGKLKRFGPCANNGYVALDV